MIPYKPARMGPRLRLKSGASSWSPPSSKSLGKNLLQEFKDRAGEFEEPAKFVAVDSAWVLGDIILHQAFESTVGDKTPPMYYGNKWLWGIPFLLVGRLVSENLVKGSPLARAATIGTTANLLMQGRYLTSGFSYDFNLTVFLIHEALHKRHILRFVARFLYAIDCRQEFFWR